MPSPFAPADASVRRLRLSPVLIGRLRVGLGLLAGALPLALLLLLLLVRAPAAQQVFVLPFWMGALALCARGAFSLRDIDTALGDERSRGRRGLLLGLCFCYFAPFVHWFLAKPSLYYLATNVFLMLLCAGWWLVLVNESLGALATACGDDGLRRDASLTAWATLILLTFLQIFLVGQVLWHQREIGGGRFPHLFLAQWRTVFFLPFLLTWIQLLRVWRRLPEWELGESGGV